MGYDQSAARAAASAYIYEHQPLDPAMLKHIGALSVSAIETAPRPYVVGPQTLEEATRTGQLAMLADRLHSHWINANEVFREGQSAIRQIP